MATEIKTAEKRPIQTPSNISFLTPLGQTYSPEQIRLSFAKQELSIRETFGRNKRIHQILSDAREFKEKNPETFNGVLLGNPEINLSGKDIQIEAQQLHYYIYFATHAHQQETRGENPEKYSALSVCGVVYDTQRKCFYMSVRPPNSQKDPGKVDAPGGTLNPNSPEAADPLKTIKSRFSRKLGLKNTAPICLGIVEIKDEGYNLVNIVYYTETNDLSPTTPDETWSAIPIKTIDRALADNKALTLPATASLLMALSQEKFTKNSWGPGRISK